MYNAENTITYAAFDELENGELFITDGGRFTSFDYIAFIGTAAAFVPVVGVPLAASAAVYCGFYMVGDAIRGNDRKSI